MSTGFFVGRCVSIVERCFLSRLESAMRSCRTFKLKKRTAAEGEPVHVEFFEISDYSNAKIAQPTPKVPC